MNSCESRNVFVLPSEYQKKNHTKKFLDKFCLTQTEVLLEDIDNKSDKEVKKESFLIILI
jgi:hypothetical protein